MLRRIAGTDNISSLRVLADVVEPVKDYTREETAPAVPTSATPLNRLIDAARPESATARQFDNWVNAMLAGKASPEVKTQMRTLLLRWRDNQTDLQPMLGESFLLPEVEPISQNLSALGAAGLAALDYLDRGERAPDAWKAEQLAIIEQAKTQKAQVLLMVAPAVQKLVEASAGQSLTH
jgi:hexosaminidase